MPTHDYDIANQSGAAFRTDLNNALKAIQTNNSNSSSPASTEAFQFWADTTAGTLKIRNAANNAWIELFQLDGTLTLEDGSASTPALAFRDDLDTGIYSSNVNTFNVATAGVERMELGATTIFNEDGADVDFRIEGDSQANLFYVDAGNDRVGIATASPNTTLDVNGDITITDKIIHGGDTNTAIRFPAADSFAVETAGAEVMRVTSTARVGIGTNNPLYPLHVKGLVSQSAPADFGVLMGLSSGDDYAQIQLNGDTGAFIDFSTSGVDQKGRILYQHSSEKFEFFVNSGKRVQFTGDGIIPNGTDTAAANAISDFEEGTWTPVYHSGVTSLGSYANTSGNYIKIGNLVTFTARVQMSSSDANFHHLIINGLPFTSSGSKKEGGVSIGFGQAINQNNTSGKPTGHISQSSSAISFFEPSGGVLYANNSNFVNLDETLHLRGFYYAN